MRRMLCVLALAAGLGGCATTDGYTRISAGVSTLPPVYSVPQYPGYLWVDGGWVHPYGGRRYWQDGYWIEDRPRVYVRDRWYPRDRLHVYRYPRYERPRWVAPPTRDHRRPVYQAPGPRRWRRY